MYTMFSKKSLADHHDLYVEFDKTYHGYWQSVLRFAKNPSGIRKGERIRVGDEHGRRCMAEVISVTSDQVVVLDLDAATFYTVPVR